MDIESLKRDSTAVEAGQWVSEIPDMGELRLRVRGMGSTAAINYRSSLERAVPRESRNRDGSIKLSVAMALTTKVLVEKVLTDWDGLRQGGKTIPYDKALAALWLTDPDYRHFADAVVWAAGIVDRGMGDVEEAVVGNSPPPSAG